MRFIFVTGWMRTRARQTFEDVLLPILKAWFRHSQRTPPVSKAKRKYPTAWGRVLGIPWPTTENVALVLSQDAAEQLVAAKNLREQQSALGEVHVYLNAEPIALRLADQAP
jgi:hypothetical protein